MNWAWIALSCCQATGTWTEDGAGIGMGIEMGMGMGIRIGNGNGEIPPVPGDDNIISWAPPPSP